MKYAALIIAAAMALPLAATAASAAPQAQVAQGALVGITDNGATAFLGVPFAAPPVGALRWAAPKPAASWSTPKLADHYSPACPQALAGPGGKLQWTDEYMHPAKLGISEDCLTLNIWTPADLNSGRAPAHDLPVLVYIYGGGFQEGSNAVATYNGAGLTKKGVIVVGINYRVGAFGFLAHPELSAEQGGASGNYGLMDQIAALTWVRDNIGAFGGDPAKVTIAGQSAGAASVNSMVASPAARGLFRGAIADSGGVAANAATVAEGEANGKAYLDALGVKTIAEARALPVDRILAAAGTRRLGPVADGKVLPSSKPPFPAASDVPMIVGSNLNEGPPKSMTVESWKADLATRYGARAGDVVKLYPGDSDAQASHSADLELSDRMAISYTDFVGRRASAKPVYAYLWTHVEPGPDSARYGAFHTSEIPYFFHTLDLSPGRNFGPLDRQLSEQMSSYWANFIKNGDPNGAGVPAWPAFNAGHQVQEIGDHGGLRTADLDLLNAGKAPAGGLFGPPPPAATAAATTASPAAR